MATNGKPQVTTAPSDVTDTVITSNQQDVKTAKPTASTRAVNSYGISVMKGGNVLGTSFVDAVVDAYANILSYQPLATLLLVVSFLYYVTQILNKPDSSPFHLIHKNVETTYNTTSHTLVQTIAGVCTIFTKATVDYHSLFAGACAMSFPYFSKPSSRNALISAFLLFTIVIMPFKPIAILALSQLFFLLVQLRAPKHKMIIVVIAIVCVFLSNETVKTLSAVGKQ